MWDIIHIINSFADCFVEKCEQISKETQMRMLSNRTLWLQDKQWYTTDENGNIVLTENAPPMARKSFKEWNKPPKMSVKRFFRILRARLF